MSAQRRIWAVSPGTSDTLFTLTQIVKQFENPLFADDLYYQLKFSDADKTSFYLANDPNYQNSKLTEKAMLGLVFNEQLPSIIENGKLNNAGIAALKSNKAYNLDSLEALISQVKEAIKASGSFTIERDKTQPVTYQQAGKNEITKFIKPVFEVPRLSAIYQSGVLIGILEKEVTTGTFATGKYAFYKVVKPVTIANITFNYLPIATSITSPSTGSPYEKTVIKFVDGSTEIKLPALPFDQAEAGIIKVLVQKGLL